MKFDPTTRQRTGREAVPDHAGQPGRRHSPRRRHPRRGRREGLRRQGLPGRRHRDLRRAGARGRRLPVRVLDSSGPDDRGPHRRAVAWPKLRSARRRPPSRRPIVVALLARGRRHDGRGHRDRRARRGRRRDRARSRRASPRPTIVGTTLDGEPFRLDDLRGRPVVVNFWGPTLRPVPDGVPAAQGEGRGARRGRPRRRRRPHGRYRRTLPATSSPSTARPGTRSTTRTARSSPPIGWSPGRRATSSTATGSSDRSRSARSATPTSSASTS